MFIYDSKGLSTSKACQRLPSCVDGSEIEYKVRCLKLPVEIQEYFKSEHEIQVSHVHYTVKRVKGARY